MPTTTIQALPYPSGSDAPAGPAQIKALAEAVETRTAMRFASIAERDAKVPAGQRIAGMQAFVDADQTLYRWSTSGTASWRIEWRATLSPLIQSGIVTVDVSSLASGSTTGTQVVTFPAPFPVAPQVVVASRLSTILQVEPTCQGMTEAAFTIRVSNVGSTAIAASSTAMFAWIATYHQTA